MSNILVVCTANQCRSPLAAALLRKAVERAGGSHTVLSGGLLEGGEPSPADLVEVARRHGIDLTGHRSRQLTPELLDGADLVLGMTKTHVRDISVMHPKAWPSTFTLREFNRRCEELDLGRMPLPNLVAAIHEGRTPTSMLAGGREEDISDPMGKGFEAFEELGATLEAETEEAATHL